MITQKSEYEIGGYQYVFDKQFFGLIFTSKKVTPSLVTLEEKKTHLTSLNIKIKNLSNNF